MAPHGTTADVRLLHAERDERTKNLFTALRADPDSPSGREIVEQIVQLYLPLSDRMARRYSNKGVEDDDLVQVARLALVKAIARYDVETGRAFAAFAVPTISGELKRHFRDRGWMVRPSRRVQELRISARTRREHLEQELGHSVSREELADDLGVTRASLDEADANDSNFRPLSIDAPSSSERPPLDGAVAAIDKDLEYVCDHVALSGALDGLDEHARQVLRLRFVEEKTQRCIAEELGASQMQVSRLLRRTLDHLRECLQDEDVESPARHAG